MMTYTPELDERQTRVVAALRDRSARLAGMYRAGLSALAAPALPGGEAARISIICHCMRELMNGLPSVMTEGATPRPTPSSESLKANLPELLAQHPDLDLEMDQDLIPVPKEVARVLSDLISTVIKEQGLNRRNAAELVTGGSDTKHPAIDQWRATQRFFLEWTHIDRKHDQDRDLPTDEVLLANMRVVEDVIEVRTALFFHNLRALEGLLAEANAVEDRGAV